MMKPTKQKLNAFPSKIRSKARTSVCTTFIQYLTRGYKQSKKTNEQSIQIQNENIKLCIFTEDAILCRKSPEIHKDTLELINKISKTAQYKINIQNSTVFLYTRNKQSKNDMKETIPFTIALKRIKCLGINLTK